jgi:hypothetical protein
MFTFPFGCSTQTSVCIGCFAREVLDPSELWHSLIALAFARLFLDHLDDCCHIVFCEPAFEAAPSSVMNLCRFIRLAHPRAISIHRSQQSYPTLGRVAPLHKPPPAASRHRAHLPANYLSQRLIDPFLPTRPGFLEVIKNVPVNSQRDKLLGIWDGRTLRREFRGLRGCRLERRFSRIPGGGGSSCSVGRHLCPR